MKPRKKKISHEELLKELDEPIGEWIVPSNQESSVSDVKSDNAYQQWSVGENGKYIPCFKTVPKVPSGVYELKMNNQLGFYIEKQKSTSDDLLSLPMDEIKEILEDIDKFWKRSDIFKKYGYTHKRGILLHGPPGNGKSYLIQLLTQYLTKDMNGIVLNLKDYSSVELYLEFAGPVIRAIESDTPIIVIMEDIDNILEYDRSTLTKVLNMLDGIKQIDKVVYIATTNYPEKLQERVSNRPSRFDRKYKISKPNAQVREYYIKHKLDKEDLEKIDLKKWVEKTKGLSISHLKELIVSVVILDVPFEKALSILKNMSDKVTSNDDAKKIGFSLLNSSKRIFEQPYYNENDIDSDE